MRWVAWSQLHRLVKREKKKRKQLEALGVEYEVTPTRPRFFSFFPLPLLFLPPPISSSSYFFLVLLVLLVLVLVLGTRRADMSNAMIPHFEIFSITPLRQRNGLATPEECPATARRPSTHSAAQSWRVVRSGRGTSGRGSRSSPTAGLGPVSPRRSRR